MVVLGLFASFCFAGSYIFIGAVVLGAGSRLFRALGFYFRKDGFTHIQGSLPEITLKNGEAKVMTWNIRGHSRGLHYAEGGVVHWQSRIKRIIENILQEEPDVIVLQEVYDVALVEEIYSRLEKFYSHFYTHFGSKNWDCDSGCMVITRCAVHNFANTDFKHYDNKARSFETLEIKLSPNDELPCARIIGTQLSPGKTDSETRMEQVVQIVNTLAKENLAMPTLFVGNLNVDRNNQIEEGGLSKYLYYSCLASKSTHSHELVSQWAPVFEGREDSCDFVSFFKRMATDGRIFPVIERGIRLLDSHLIKGFDEDYNTKTALSDHHAVVTTFSGLKSIRGIKLGI